MDLDQDSTFFNPRVKKKKRDEKFIFLKMYNHKKTAGFLFFIHEKRLFFEVEQGSGSGFYLAEALQLQFAGSTGSAVRIPIFLGLETDVDYNDRMWYRRVFT